MKLVLFPILAISALSSCSSVKNTVTKVKETTTDTFRAAKEKTLGPSEPKLRLTKADPSRFLPEGTSVAKVKAKSTTPEPKRKGKMLLAKNTPAKTSGPAASTAAEADLSEIPPLELPPLPAPSENDSGEFMGILPSLDGSEGATFIEVEGETPELPPLAAPELTEEESAEKKA
ncbi:hypothetical protein [Roseibacillus persicicus]|uniref:hypothetical protein n=1 Tax=Roseibacillus persicicus TaxID=454148 RepID=UPI00280F9B42|nr:hypothetical protein [Roseibacillus persicicus]MDQ8190848.1 hypothetical protein [Roseibacillus persicicus]